MCRLICCFKNTVNRKCVDPCREQRKLETLSRGKRSSKLKKKKRKTLVTMSSDVEQKTDFLGSYFSLLLKHPHLLPSSNLHFSSFPSLLASYHHSAPTIICDSFLPSFLLHLCLLPSFVPFPPSYPPFPSSFHRPLTHLLLLKLFYLI